MWLRPRQDAMSNDQRYTRSQARAKSQAMDNDIVPKDSVSQVSKEHSTRMTSSHASSTCSTTHSASSHGSSRSREQLNLDISALAIKMNSQEKRAQLKRNKLELEKRKLEIDLDIEQNELKEQMDLAKNEMKILYENQTQDQGSSSASHVDTTSITARAPEQEQRLRNPSNADINKMLEECYTFLGSGKIDMNGAKACRVYGPSTTSANQVKKKQTVKTKLSLKSIEPEKALKRDPEKLAEKLVKYETDRNENEAQRPQRQVTIPDIGGERPGVKVPGVRPLKCETEPALVTRHLQNEEYEYSSLPAKYQALQKESAIGYFPSPKYKAKTVDREKECTGYELPDRTPDKALEALYRQQTIMMGALQAPKIELLEFHGDPMSYHSFIRSFEENVEKMLPDDGARVARLIHLCKGEAGRAIRCCNLMDPKQGYARARRLLKQRFGDKHTITELWIKKLSEGGPRVNLQEYADELLDCYESLNVLGALQEMEEQRNLLAMIMRLPVHLQNKWQDYVFDLRSCKDRCPTLKDVVDVVDRAAAVVSDPVYGSASMRSKRSEKTTTRVAYVATADVRCPICDDGEHSVPQCRTFLNMSPNDRLDVALKNQICFMCLTPGHITRECSNPVKCQARKCGQWHATMLHDADWEGLRRASKEKRDATARSSASSDSEGNHVSFNSSHHVMGNKVALPFLLVKVTSPETGISVKTYALLDSGSNISLCQDRLLKLLKARGRTEKMSLTTLEKENSEAMA